MRLFSLGLIGCTFAALLIAPCWASGQQIDPDRKHALTAPVSELARRALADIAPELVEVQRPTFTGLAGPSGALYGLTFATKARSTGEPGLCEATTISIESPSISSRELYEPLYTTTVYKVVGNLKPIPEMWDTAYGARLSKKCSEAGRVIPSNTSAFDEERFFEAKIDGDIRVWFGARTLELALEKAHAAQADVQCDTDGNFPEWPQLCHAELTSFKSLKLQRLLLIKMVPCDDLAGCYAVSGYFLCQGIGNVQTAWILSAQVDIPDATASGDVRNVRALKLGFQQTITD